MKVRSVASTPEFDALEAQWTELHRACEATAFQSFEWLRAWWRHFGEANACLQLRILVLEEDDRIVGIAPFVLETLAVLGIFRLRRLSLLGEGLSDYLDLLAHPERADAACDVLAAHLTAGVDWDLISLVDVPDRSALHTRFLAALRLAGLRCRKHPRVQCPRAQLLETWPKTLASFTTDRRRKLTFLDRRLKKNFKVTLRHVEGGSDMRDQVSAFVVMHQTRWKKLGHGGAFADARAIDFIQDIAQAFHARGWLRLTFLQVDGQDAAAVIAFHVARQLQVYLAANAALERVARYSPGTALYAYCIERAIDEGARICDFLRSPARYKYLLGAVNVPNWRLLAFRAGALRARLLHKIHMLSRKIARRLRASMRPMRRLRGSVD